MQGRPGNFKYRAIGLDGKGWKKHCLTIQLGPKPTSDIMGKHWPASPEENMERLKDCGITTATNIPSCDRCYGKYLYLTGMDTFDRPVRQLRDIGLATVPFLKKNALNLLCSVPIAEKKATTLELALKSA